MKNLLWRIINSVLAILIFGVAVTAYQDPKNYLLWGGILAVAVSIANLGGTKRNTQARFSGFFAILPAVYVLGLFGTIAATSALGTKMFLAIAGAVLFLFYEWDFPKKPLLSFEEIYTLSAAFLVLTALWAGSFFLHLPWWAVMLAAFVIFYLLFWQGFHKMNILKSDTILWALISALIMAEIVWAISFWPVYFLTAAAVSFAGFYLVYILSDLHFKGALSAKQVYFQIAIILVVLLFSLLSSSWQPLGGY